jgi:hypothetical protein
VLVGQIVRVDGAVLTVMLSDLVVVSGGVLESLTCAVKLKLPVALGVPEIAPVVGLSVKPDGSEPLAKDHVYDGVPPLAVRVAE